MSGRKHICKTLNGGQATYAQVKKWLQSKGGAWAPGIPLRSATICGVLHGQGTDYFLVFRSRGCNASFGRIAPRLYGPDSGIDWPKWGNRVATAATVVGGSSNNMSVTIRIVYCKKNLVDGVDLVWVTNCSFHMKNY